MAHQLIVESDQYARCSCGDWGQSTNYVHRPVKGNLTCTDGTPITEVTQTKIAPMCGPLRPSATQLEGFSWHLSHLLQNYG